MQKYYLEYSLNAACEMIKAYYVDRNVGGVLKHLNPQNFTFISYDSGLSFDDLKNFAAFLENSLEYLVSYKLIDENYTIGGQSQDSCFVIAKIKLIDTRTQKIFELHFFFYFNQFGNEVICPHYHVASPINTQKKIRSVFFNANAPEPKLPGEIQSHKEELIDFMNSNAVAEKSFYYAENFPYRFVNREFMNLLGYEKISEFITEENNSMLVNVHVADQRKYVEYLHSEYKNINKFNSDEKYQYQSSYCVKYRLQSPQLSEEISVLEWGNFFTLNGRTIVNCFVLNLNEVENISLGNEENDIESSATVSVRENFGIHISKEIVIYPMRRQIKINDDLIELTQVESEIFLVLADNLNKPISMEEIYRSIWKNNELHLTSNALPMHISNIRRKLNHYESLIQLNFIRNKGYCLHTT